MLESRGSLGGAATTEAPWEDAPHLQGHAAVLRDEPDAADDRARTSNSRGTATRCIRWARPTRPFPEGGSLIIYEDDPKRTHERAVPVSPTIYGRAAPTSIDSISGISEVIGPLLTQFQPNVGLRSSRRICSTWPTSPRTLRTKGRHAARRRTSPAC